MVEDDNIIRDLDILGIQEIPEFNINFNYKETSKSLSNIFNESLEYKAAQEWNRKHNEKIIRVNGALYINTDPRGMVSERYGIIQIMMSNGNAITVTPELQSEPEYFSTSPGSPRLSLIRRKEMVFHNLSINGNLFFDKYNLSKLLTTEEPYLKIIMDSLGMKAEVYSTL